MRSAKAGITADDKKDTVVIAFYCNAGEHRSVAMAELFGRLHEANIQHLCNGVWRRKYCGGCAECSVRGAKFQRATTLLGEMLA